MTANAQFTGVLCHSQEYGILYALSCAAAGVRGVTGAAGEPAIHQRQFGRHIHARGGRNPCVVAMLEPDSLSGVSHGTIVTGCARFGAADIGFIRTGDWQRSKFGRRTGAEVRHPLEVTSGARARLRVRLRPARRLEAGLDIVSLKVEFLYAPKECLGHVKYVAMNSYPAR
jgi:hypothetical protein